MRLSPFIRPGGAALAVVIVISGCGFGHQNQPTNVAPQQTNQSTRKITRSSEQVVTVDSAEQVVAHVVRFVTRWEGSSSGRARPVVGARRSAARFLRQSSNRS